MKPNGLGQAVLMKPYARWIALLILWVVIGFRQRSASGRRMESRIRAREQGRPALRAPGTRVRVGPRLVRA